jgi:predicted dehydrogenase
MEHQGVNVAIIGLGFGAEFIPIYQNHPDANIHTIYQRTESKLDEIGDAFGIDQRYQNFEGVLADPATA